MLSRYMIDWTHNTTRQSGTIHIDAQDDESALQNAFDYLHRKKFPDAKIEDFMLRIAGARYLKNVDTNG